METVRRLYELMTRGDDGLLELVAPDFVVDFSRRLIDPFVARVDPDAFASFFREARETLRGELPRWEPEELIDGGDKVLALIRVPSRGEGKRRRGGCACRQRQEHADGKPVELKYFGEDRDAAFEAAGLFRE